LKKEREMGKRTKREKRKILESCPTCGEDLEITQLHCTSCETAISARYTPCRFCKLPPESLQLIETFLRCRGNVKEMERELGLSYPTVRARLDDALRELGLGGEPAVEEESTDRRQEILEQLNRGEIKAAEAAILLSEAADGVRTET
jgi:hypothetical protein